MKTSLDFRTRLLRAMRTELDVWDRGFAYVAAHLPAAVLPRGLVVDMTPGCGVPLELIAEYDGSDSGRIARLAGIPYEDEPEQRTGSGLLLNVTAEEITSVIHVIWAIEQGVASIDHGGGFSFDEATLAEYGLTLTEVCEHMAGLDLAGAVRLLAEAAEVPLHMLVKYQARRGAVTHRPVRELVLVSIDDFGPFPAYVDRRERWNGWACPAFSREVVDLIIAHVMRDLDKYEGDEFRWDPDNETVLLQISGTYNSDGNPLYDNRNYTSGRRWKRGELMCGTPAVDRIEPDEDGLYPIGSHSWCWSIDDELE